jgi:D-xylose transport system ATP-binding protein
VAPSLEARAIAKAFSGVSVLEDVSFSAAPGEVVALVGENGAGKSTLMKIIAGVHPHGSFGGEVLVDGRAAHFRSPVAAEAAGVVMIPQELQPVPALTVAENLFLGALPKRRGRIDWHATTARARAVFEEVGVDIDATAPMGRLMPAQQQLVAISRALHREAKVLILDEPTASLSQSEAALLFEHIERLKERRLACIYVSHRLDEVTAIADRVVVLRDGRLAEAGRASELSQEQIVTAMLGRRVEQVFPERSARPEAERVLTVRDLTVKRAEPPQRTVVDSLDLHVDAGEIVGLFGLVGAGRTEAALALFGGWRGDVEGTVEIAGSPAVIRRPADAIRHGMALVTEDRKESGLVLDMGIAANMSLASLGRVSRGPVLDRRRESALARSFTESLKIRSRGVDQPVRELSGGTQQKVVLAKWLASGPRLLVLDEPTRGIDVGTKAQIYEDLCRLADDGLGVLLISSELPEVLGLSDRIIVMYKGRRVADVRRDEADAEMLLGLATGGLVHDGRT